MKKSLAAATLTLAALVTTTAYADRRPAGLQGSKATLKAGSQASRTRPGHKPGHGNYNPGHGNYNPGHGGYNPGHGGYNPGHSNNNPGHGGYNPGHGGQLPPMVIQRRRRWMRAIGEVISLLRQDRKRQARRRLRQLVERMGHGGSPFTRRIKRRLGYIQGQFHDSFGGNHSIIRRLRGVREDIRRSLRNGHSSHNGHSGSWLGKLIKILK